MSVHDCMKRGVEVIFGDESLQAAATKMASHAVGYLPVCDGDELVGIVTEAQLRAAGGRDPRTTAVQEVMSYDVACCFDDEDEGRLLAQMLRRRLQRVLVVDRQRRLLGVVTPADLRQPELPVGIGPQRPLAS